VTQPTDTTAEGRSRRRSPGARAALVIAIAAAGLVFGRPIIYSDGAVYYALSESLARDFDFDLANQRHLTASEWRAVAHFEAEGGRRSASLYSGGAAVMNLPFLWPMIQLHDRFGFLASLDALGMSLQRIPLAYGLAILLASFVYTVLGALCVHAVARRFVADWWAVFVTLVMMLSVPVLMFGLWQPSYSHAGDAFLVALALWMTVRLTELRTGPLSPPLPSRERVGVRVERESPSPQRSLKGGEARAEVPSPPVGKGGGDERSPAACAAAALLLLLIGAALGLATFVRVINVVLFVPLGVYLWWHFARHGAGVGRILCRAGVVALGAAPFAALVLAYNRTNYGAALTTAYHTEVGWSVIDYPFPHSLWLWARNVACRLANPSAGYGVLVWAPATGAAVVGLLLRRRDRAALDGLRLLCLWSVVAPVLVMGLWMVKGDRGHGAPRLFIEWYPFLAVGLAALVARVRRVPARAAAAFGLVALTGYAMYFQAARMSWRAETRVDLMFMAEGASRPRWRAYSPFELARAAFDDDAVPAREPSRGVSGPARILRGAQPSVGTLILLAVRHDLPVVVTAVRPTARVEKRILDVDVVLNRPMATGMRLAIDVFEFVPGHGPGRGRRGRRWGRFVSAPLDGADGQTVYTLSANVDAAAVFLFSGRRAIGLPGHRVQEDHAAVTAEATHFHIRAAPLRDGGTDLDRGNAAVIENPWRQAGP